MRDLATWIVDSAEAHTTGVFDGVGRVQTREEFLAGIRDGLGSDARFTWVPQEFLAEGRWSRGWGRGRCRSGCRSRSTPA